MKEENKIFLKEYANKIGVDLAEYHGKPKGFVLVVFDFGGENAEYIANTEGLQMVHMLRLSADSLERLYTIPEPIGNA